MAMVADSIPILNLFMRFFSVSEASRELTVRMMMTFILHYGRMSCSQAAGALPMEARNKAQVTRFLARPRWKSVNMSAKVADMLLKRQAVMKGRFIVKFDATLIKHQGAKTENTFATGSRENANRKRRRKKGKKKQHRYGKTKHSRKASGPFHWSGPTHFFDNRANTLQCHTRQCQNPDVEQSEVTPRGTGGTLHVEMAN
jgi:hypothetical protein